MKRSLPLLFAIVALTFAPRAAEQVAPPGEVTPPSTVAPGAPSLEQRVADIEAYMNNTARATADDESVHSIVPGPGPGHNAWLMTSAALVLFMTLPGLALFYGGLVRRKNVLSVLAQCLGVAGMVTILWWACGYSLVFAEDTSPFFGNFKYAFFDGVTSEVNPSYTLWVSQNIFAMFQLMFAIITPALIVGAIAERMKFSAIMLFVGIWMFLVYFPLAHMVWGATGFMNGAWNADAKIATIDFAGGTVVHMSSGWSALVLCLLLGKRLGFGKEPMPPHSMVLCMVGTGMLWVGWYGFNAGSALGSDGIAANAFTTTTLCAATAAFVWGITEYFAKGKPSVLGFCSGAVAGLVVITPACGFVNTTSAVIMGVFAGVVPYFAVTKLKAAFGYDDALDTFGIHAIGGTLGAILTGVFASAEVNPNIGEGNAAAVASGLAAAVANGTLWIEQLKAVALTLVLSIGFTLIIALIVRAVIGLRASEEVETIGLDLAEHGEEAYHGV